MSSEQDTLDCAVVGAGLSGLVAGSELLRAGKRVAVLERSTTIGGRMASWPSPSPKSKRSSSQATFDLGAQYFTIRDERFKALVNSWKGESLVREWSKGFATSDGSYYEDGLTRFCGLPSMLSIPEHVARNLDVRLGMGVSKVLWRGTSWRILIEDGRFIDSKSLILTPPVPLSLAIINASHIEIPDGPRSILNRIEYEPCIAVMVLLQEKARLPDPGGMWAVGEPVSWIADNHRKGVSSRVGAVTIHAGPDFSEDQWDLEDAAIIRELTASAGKWLGSPILDAWVKKWRYSKPFMIYPEPVLYLRKPGPLVFAGDAFAGPRVEGAALSGLAAAAVLL